MKFITSPVIAELSAMLLLCCWICWSGATEKLVARNKINCFVFENVPAKVSMTQQHEKGFRKILQALSFFFAVDLSGVAFFCVSFN